MSDVNSVSSYMSLSAASESSTSTSTATEEMGADAFLELLLIQLKNQNPLEPMEETEMISQMAQLNSVQELRNMSNSLDSVNQSNQFLSSSSLIGKMVSYLDSEDETVSSLVKSVSIKDGEVLINTEDAASLSMSDILEVWEE
jgi:flagellar basal-body rod modification protein FlgD